MDKPVQLSELMAKAQPTFVCPSRSRRVWGPQSLLVFSHNAHWRPFVAKTDYAINEGDFITDTEGGPPTLTEGDKPTYPWRDTSKATGVLYLHSQVRPGDLLDGIPTRI